MSKANKYIMANIGYIRVSSIQQITDRQLEGVALDKTFTDKASGKNTDRPQLKAMLDYVREGDTIHVHDLSRLGRSTVDVLTLVDKLSQKGIKVHFHKEGLITGDDNPTSKMILTIFSAVAEAERKMMLERQREGYEAAKAAGRVVGRGNGKAVDRKVLKLLLLLVAQLLRLPHNSTLLSQLCSVLRPRIKDDHLTI